MIVNGTQQALPKSITIADYLTAVGYESKHVVVERNRTIVPRNEFKNTWLLDTDTLEIVHFVGGG